MSQGSSEKKSASSRGTETVLRNIFPYQVTVMVETNDYTNEKNNFYNGTVQIILHLVKSMIILR